MDLSKNQEIQSVESDELTDSYSKEREITHRRYMIGGMTSIFPGFGIGHMIQGRYMKGLQFALLDLWAMSISTILFIFFGTNTSIPDSTPMEKIMNYIGFLLAPVPFAGVRAWELFSAFSLPYYYKIVERSPIHLKPFYTYNTNPSHRKTVRRTLVFSLKYQF